MTMTEFLPMITKMKQISSSRCIGLCPAHSDTSPSLSITEGDRGLLLRCWAGCDLANICEALGIETKDLFYDALDTNPQKRREAARLREAKLQQHAQDALLLGRFIDACKAAERYLDAREPADISAWSDEQLDRELSLACDAMRVLEEDLYAC